MDGIASSLIEKRHQTTPYSLLVQSLIKQLCHFLEVDKDKSTQLYNKICAKLHEMKFIDESYGRSEFENIRMSYEIALKQLVEATRGNALPVSELEVWPLTHNNKQAALEWSRYFRDFQEIEKIGEGGFGDVWKSKHRLDNIDYAVKKICVKATSVKNILNHLREVKTLASLSHVNIVPYKSCWLEPLISLGKDEKPLESFQSTATSEEDSNFESTVYSNTQDSLRLKSDSFTVDFVNSQEDVREEKSSSTINESYSRLEKIRKLNEAKGALIPHVKLTWAVLYIQMKLCQKTLRNFLDERNELPSFDEYYQRYQCFVKPAKVSADQHHQIVAFKVFHQMCSGLEYIHGKNIVHHDIKPSNVFISHEETGDLVFQLGDFGLACPLENNDVVRHNGFGTRLYAAMEQLDGQCCKKSDIYSLGVILLELLSKCVTVMECFKKVEKLKKGETLEELDEDSFKMIKQLMNQRFDNRPSITDLRQSVQKKIESSTEVERLKRMISDKDDQLQRKDQEIDELMKEIRKLRKQLSQP